MTPSESLELRTQMAEMHDSVLKRIEKAYRDKQYIEVCWLCYACFESRINRSLMKLCTGCNKPERTDSRHIGITTKLECFIRLIKCNYPPLSDANAEYINSVKSWCKQRNMLIHGMVTLNYYNDADKKFKELAGQGRTLIKKMYILGTNVREYYYSALEIPAFDESVSKRCPLKCKCIKDNY